MSVGVRFESQGHVKGGVFKAKRKTWHRSVFRCGYFCGQFGSTLGSFPRSNNIKNVS
jgi:hypothetical protein